VRTITRSDADLTAETVMLAPVSRFFAMRRRAMAARPSFPDGRDTFCPPWAYASGVSILLAVAAGVVLAASAGLRAFVPLFAVGVASRAFGWDVATEMQWLASNTALTCFGIASALEVTADKIPVVDHALDAVHTIVGPIAGALAALSVWLHFPPAVAAFLALAVGAPIAGGVHLLAATTRVKSSAVSGGTLNPVASTVEDGLTLGAILVAILAPLLALALTLVLVIVAVRYIRRRRRARST
jgi:hypothetical protein